MHADAAAGGDEDVAVMQRVCEVGQAGVGSRTRRVDFGRTLHGERLVWSFGIEFLDKVVEAGLLRHRNLGQLKRDATTANFRMPKRGIRTPSQGTIFHPPTPKDGSSAAKRRWWLPCA